MKYGVIRYEDGSIGIIKESQVDHWKIEASVLRFYDTIEEAENYITEIRHYLIVNDGDRYFIVKSVEKCECPNCRIVRGITTYSNALKFMEKKEYAKNNA